MGLVPTPEHGWAADSIQSIARIAPEHIDLDAFVRIAREAPPIRGVCPPADLGGSTGQRATGRTRVWPASASCGTRRSNFTTPKTSRPSTTAGAQIVSVSPLAGREPARASTRFTSAAGSPRPTPRSSRPTRVQPPLREMVADGLPVYAECGGLMYLGEELVLEGQSYPMAGSCRSSFGLFKRPQGHGYTVVAWRAKTRTTRPAPRSAATSSTTPGCCGGPGRERDLVFRMRRGVGIHGDRDGIVHKNVLATYTHIHALGHPGWAQRAGPQCRRIQSQAHRTLTLLPRRPPGAGADRSSRAGARRRPTFSRLCRTRRFCPNARRCRTPSASWWPRARLAYTARARPHLSRALLRPPGAGFRAHRADPAGQTRRSARGRRTRRAAPAGAAFGAGRHPTTRLALRGIEFALSRDGAVLPASRQPRSGHRHRQRGAGDRGGRARDRERARHRPSTPAPWPKPAHNVRLNGLDGRIVISDHGLERIDGVFSLVAAIATPTCGCRTLRARLAPAGRRRSRHAHRRMRGGGRGDRWCRGV